MADLSCSQAELLGADVAMGRASEADRVRLEAHLERCETCRRRADRLDAFAELLRNDVPVRSDERRDRAVLDRAFEAASQQHHEARAGSRGSLLAAAAVLLLAVGGVAVWFATRGDPEAVARDEAPGERGVRATAPERPARPAPERSPAERAPAPAEAPLALLPLESSPCPGVTVVPSEETRAWVLASQPRSCRLALDLGELRVRVDASAGAGLSIDTPSTTVNDIGTTFLVRVDERGGTMVTVLDGAVTVQSGQELVRVDRERALAWPVGAAPPVVEEAGATDLDRLRALTPEVAVASAPPRAGTSPRPAPGGTAPVADLRRLLARGQAAEARAQAEERSALPEYARLRGELLTVIAESYAVERDDQRALETYRRVWTASRGGATAANAILAAADIAADRLRDHRQAAELYEQYLREYPSGPLREAATIGRCRSLRAGGRRAESQTCAREYLDGYPEGRLRRQAEGLLD